MALRRNWGKIDKHASQATEEHCKTFQSLIAYLEQPVKRHPDRDIYMTRALIFWWYCNESKDTNQMTPDTPFGVLKLAKSGKMPFAAAFKELCEKANVRCAAVSGICKSGSYEPGDMDEEQMYGSWNKVWLQGKWWPLYPRWIIQSLAGVNRDDFKPVTGKENEGKESASSHAQTLNQFNDFWFLTDPKIFVNKCFPDDPNDQMLPPSKRVKTKRKFLRLPYYTLNFFRAGLRLTSDDSCIVEAEDGIGIVSFRSDRIKAKTLVFEYELFIKHTQDGAASAPVELPSGRLVLNTRRKGNFIFEVRCPVEGTYKLDIRGGEYGASKHNVYLKTTIRCREKVDSIVPLPVEIGDIGFGVGPAATNNGLTKPSVPTPKVCVVPKKAAEFKFKLEKDPKKQRVYTAQLFGRNQTDTELKGCVKTSTGKQDLTVAVTVPKGGEYVLRISCADGPTGQARAICNYLLTSEENQDKVAEEYYDSSDGFSEDDEEIDKMEKEVKKLKARMEELLKIRAAQTGEELDISASMPDLHRA